MFSSSMNFQLQMSTKKYSHKREVEVWWECLGLRAWETAPQYLWENCSKEAGVRLYTSLQQREQTVWTTKIRFQVKEFSILCMRACKPLGSLNSFFSFAPQLSEAKAVLAFPQLLSIHSGGGAASARSQFWELSFTFGGQKSLMALTFLIY